MGGVRLWSGAEAHIDCLAWQGFGLANTLGAAGFPNGEAYRIGTADPNGAVSRLFVRQTIGLGGRQEDVPDGQLALAGRQDVSRLTFTLGRYSAADIFDVNAYANNPNTQFLNWALINNEAWDYPADTIGYDTGLTLELNQPQWALRYGFFEVPSLPNSLTADDRILKWPYSPTGDGPSQSAPLSKAWAMAAEFERRYAPGNRPGAVRLLAFLNRADMTGYSAAIPILEAGGADANIAAAKSYRLKYGFGLNAEQEVAKNVGMFSRLGWNDGQEQAYMFDDADYTASLGASIDGAAWNRPGDTFGLAGAANGISRAEQKYFEAGGLGILAGDGNLNYGWEGILETYYSYQIRRNLHATADYQFIGDPAFNSARGPVSIFAFRLHWEL